MFRNVFFVQGEDAHEYLAELDARGASGFVDYLAELGAFNWDGELYEQCAAGSSDQVEQVNRYHVSYNLRIGYVGVDFWHFKSELV